MITENVRTSPIISEFTPEEINRHFDIRKEGSVSHVDTLYYSVSLNRDCKAKENWPPGIKPMIDLLTGFRERKLSNRSNLISFCGLSFEPTTFVHYQFCLRLEENFDIFISSLLPNDSTPRIVVQLRTRILVLKGVCKAICTSFQYVEKILNEFGLEVDKVTENRIDYAWHTNLIQNPYKYFSDDLLLKNLKSKLRLYHKVGKIGSKIDLDYVSFGQRKSNDIFVRIYNKSQEVIKKNYKSFFFQKWLDDKLINQYDFFVYNRAYELKSYESGLLIGRIEWYLKYGHNEEIKDELIKVKKSCYVNSDNIDQLRKKVDMYLPPVTLIVNVEYQTKRKFYRSIDPWIQSFAKAYFENGKFLGFLKNPTPLFRLFTVYTLRSEICNYLTTETLSFVDDKGKKDEKLCYWWKRINQCQIDEYEKRIINLWREHEQHSDIERSKRRVYGSVASLSVLKNGGYNDSSFMEDVSDTLCILNDNDVFAVFLDKDTGEVLDFNPGIYQDVKTRRARQYRSIHGKKENN